MLIYLRQNKSSKFINVKGVIYLSTIAFKDNNAK